MLTEEANAITITTDADREVVTMWAQDGKLQVIENCDDYLQAELNQSEVQELIDFLTQQLDQLKD
ncbi:coil containing protein [Vibrio phage 1.238.A._10N.261.52.F10]|uniref:Coil containing protein n=1 Tax=Vibrio phage 1.238.A._10N.261.52.F10 TaxID=1881231 RepID=A0A2I7RUM3_9CAUD|nr:coil containing protein [Vibrio phage 1.238.A._10N.261.52.F10]AUR97339.1 coil containing protein [Vibrio phage 1.238.A._10N.261.52.F10]AUR97433.1 coil containing protein [Vibrio phage 1.238.B._10N.261.52.F10]